RAGARVTGTDPTARLLAAAPGRAEREDLTVTWRDGVAERIDAPDHSFDRVLSVFASMYAPDPRTAAGELLRCCRPDGRVVVAAWTPDSFMSATNRAMAPYLPPPDPAGTPPVRWGDPDFVRGLFGAAGASVASGTSSVRFEFRTADEAVGFWTRTAGHLQAQRSELESTGAWDGLLADLRRCFVDAAGGDTAPVVVHSTYLLTVVEPGGGSESGGGDGSG
ncbi:class I SAM-dependent methyltransferase, partial [Micromonospora zhanjiangensis]